MQSKTHWEGIDTSKSASEVSWFQEQFAAVHQLLLPNFLTSSSPITHAVETRILILAPWTKFGFRVRPLEIESLVRLDGIIGGFGKNDQGRTIITTDTEHGLI